MTEPVPGKNSPGTLRKLLTRGFLLTAGVCILGVIALKIYLGTEHASALLSRTLTSYLHQPVRVTGLSIAGGAIHLTGVSLGNPPELPPGNLVAVDAIVIAPDWRALLAGRRSLRLVSLERPRIDLLKNSVGIWNFSQLQHLLSSNKSAGKELFIEQFVVKAGAFQVNGQGAKGISFRILNLATKGSSSAQLSLSFEDPARNSYTVTGTALPGPDPAFDLTVAAPSLSLNRLAGLLQPNSQTLPDEGSGSLQVTAALRDGRVRATGRLDFSRLSVPLPHGALPVTGSIAVAAAYTIKTDEVSLESLTVTAGNLMKAHAAGTITGLKSDRRFTVSGGIDELNLAPLSLLLPEKERRNMAMGGTLQSSEFRVAGDGTRGLVKADGLFMLKDGSLERKGQRFFTALNGRVTVSGTPEGFLAKGTLSQGSTRDVALLETLQAPFEILLSNRLKLLKAEIPSLQADVMGLPVTGRLGYHAGARAPFNVDLKIPTVTFSSLHHLPENLNLQIPSGSGSLALKGAGRGPQDFTVTASARVADMRGVRGGTRFGIKSGIVDSRIIRSNGHLDVTGKAGFSGLSLDDRTGDAHFSYRIADGAAYLDNTAFSFAGVSGTIARLKTSIPAKESIAGTVRYPITLEVAGGEFRRDRAEVSEFSGTLHGSYRSDPHGKWLEGSVDCASGRVAWQGKTVASPAVHVTFSRSGGRGTISGRLLEGALTGELAFNPFSLREAANIKVGIKGGHVPILGSLLPRSGAATLAKGTFGGTASGTYSGASGLACRFDLVAADLAVTDSGGKTILGDGGIDLAGGMSGTRLVIDKTLLTAGKEVALQVTGEIANPLSPQREGHLDFSLPRTPLNSIIDPFVNILPRMIQEATVDGSLASKGKLILRDGRQQLDGALVLTDVLFEVPSQKLKIAAVNGRIPVSLQLSGDTPVTIRKTASFSRDNYSGLLKQLHAVPASGHQVTIGSVDFGALHLGNMQMQFSAGNGVTRIESLRSSLYDGDLLGTGSIAMKKGPTYRADLLINGLSLKRFCSTIPAIKDYISGRVDGVISLNGTGKTVAGLAGYTDLWVREGAGEKMLVSKDFLQKLSGKKLSGFFFRSDRPYDRAEITAILKDGDLTFNKLDIVNTNFFGVRDLSVTIAPGQNRIALDHLLTAVKQAAERGKAGTGGSAPPAEQEFKWQD
jgi:uncharacterized protein involved in outer membrane biogenesis